MSAKEAWDELMQALLEPLKKALIPVIDILNRLLNKMSK